MQFVNLCVNIYIYKNNVMEEVMHGGEGEEVLRRGEAISTSDFL